jgi:hypothetical protein
VLFLSTNASSTCLQHHILHRLVDGQKSLDKRTKQQRGDYSTQFGLELDTNGGHEWEVPRSTNGILQSLESPDKLAPSAGA